MEYQVDEEYGNYTINRIDNCSNVAKISDLSESTIRSALNNSSDLNYEIEDIRF